MKNSKIKTQGKKMKTTNKILLFTLILISIAVIVLVIVIGISVKKYSSLNEIQHNEEKITPNTMIGNRVKTSEASAIKKEEIVKNGFL